MGDKVALCSKETFACSNVSIVCWFIFLLVGKMYAERSFILGWFLSLMSK